MRGLGVSPIGYAPVRSREERDAVGTFLLAQGWAALHFGDTLRRVEEEGQTGFGLLALRDRAGAVRALALAHGTRLHLYVPAREEFPAAAGLLAERLGSLDRVTCLEAHLPGDPGPSFEASVREMTVAATLRVPARPLLPVRVATPADAGALWRTYDAVPWMRLASSAEWAARVERERTWVAELDGSVVAAARWTKSFGTVVEVGGVATTPERRRRGAATSVVVVAAAAALDEGLTPVLCFQDPELRPLYYPMGFEFVGREFVFRRRPG
ncbi:MAG: GNAT family N-acetyltransferase [Candidatus Dormibacteria bacterium]